MIHSMKATLSLDYIGHFYYKKYGCGIGHGSEVAENLGFYMDDFIQKPEEAK